MRLWVLIVKKGEVAEPVGKVAHDFGTGIRIMYCKRVKGIHMNKAQLFSTESLTDLQDFMFDTMASADMAVDWFCDRHEVNATDEVIDFVVDAHFAFFGE